MACKVEGWKSTELESTWWHEAQISSQKPQKWQYYVEILTLILGHPKKYTGKSIKGVFVFIQPP